MPESLGRNGQRVCADCATAHRAIAGHLKQMFAAPPVDRVSSVRAKLFNQIFGAAEELADKDGTPPEQSPHHAHNSVHLPTLLRETQRCTVPSVGTPDGTQGGRNCRGESALDFANHKISGALRRVLNQTAHAAARKKGSYFQAVFRRLLPRLGYKSAIWAIAHRLCRVVWKISHEGVRFASFSTTTPVIDSYPA
jgi:hypothetical protein